MHSVCNANLRSCAPPRWENYVQCYRVTFAQRNIVRERYVSDSTTYLNRDAQTTLMNYNDQAGQLIGLTVNKVVDCSIAEHA